MLVARKPLVSVRFISALAKIMAKHCVVPDVIDAAPKFLADVYFDDDIRANQGNVLTPTQTKSMPLVKWKNEENVFYTLCMTDPDVPSRHNPKYREWHHWLVANIPGNDIEKGETLSAYIPAAPPKHTGLHRYVILVYQQKGKISFKEKRLSNKSAEDRAYFSIKRFANKYKFPELIAGNYFHAQYDDFVPHVYKQIGLKM